MGQALRAFGRYYSLVISRASRDTKAWFGWRVELVIFPLLYFLGFLGLSWYRGFDFAWDETISNLFLSFVPAGMLAVLIFVIQLAMAPVRIWQERSFPSGAREIPIAVEIPHALQLFRPSAADPIEASGWMLFLQTVRITNRSTVAHVGLGMTLHVRLLDNARSLPRLSVREDGDFGLWKQHSPPGAPQYLRCPLNVPPGQTVQGMVGFWVQPFIENALGAKGLDAVIARRDDPVYGARDAELEIVDYVSGDVMTVAVPGEYPRTKQTPLSVRFS